MKIFKRSIFIALSCVFLSQPVSAEVISSFWQTEKSQHFIIYYQEAQPAFVDELINKAEDYYNSIVDELGYRRFDFWSWDNRAKIYLYPNAGEFHKDTNREQWAGAVVTVDNRTIRSFVGQNDFFDSLLPHEMTHIIFREFVGRRISLPLWIDEGVACSQEKSHLKARLQIAKNMAAQNNYIKFSNFSEIYRIGSDIQPQLFYAQAASMIVFLIQGYGKDRFLDFSRALRDGTEYSKALFKVYRFASFDEMEAAWKDFMLGQSLVID